MERSSPLARIAVSASLVVAALIPTAASARTGAPFLTPGIAADAPSGFVEMCGRDVASCSPTFEAVPPPPATLAAGSVPVCGNDPAPPLAMLMARGADSRAFHALLTRCAPSATAGSPIEGATGAISTDLVRSPAPTIAVPDRRAGRDAAKLVRAVNAEVNRTIRQATDLDLYGEDEIWQRPGALGAGDCEDLAMEKRARLVAAGFDPAKLAYGVVFRHGIGLHVVLVARLAGGDMVLDSLDFRVRGWSRADYRWLRVQAFGAPMTWTTVAAAPAPLGRTTRAS